jgi:hypothetical protein
MKSTKDIIRDDHLIKTHAKYAMGFSIKNTARFLVCLALTPVQAFAAGECPLVEGEVLGALISSEMLVEALASIPSERDEFQTSADYTAMVLEAFGPATKAKVFEVHENDRSFISYNADEQRIEVGTGHFDDYDILDFEQYKLNDFFELTIDDFERYKSEHLIVGLAEKTIKVGFTGYERVSVSLHGGLYEGIERPSAWSFAPDEFSVGDYGLRSPTITIPMAADMAREEMPSLRAVIATTGLSEDFFVTNTYYELNTQMSKVTSTNFLFTSEILCGGFIDSQSRIIKVVPMLDEQIPYQLMR